ncbi:MAG TPA: dihydrofolate reductase family protein [Streptosporangiaceae bacterium]|nr:dihydrofolate reductase family protein [Streptosporangiaceae bacterium]
MGKVLYSATMSLDGFIAGPGGDMSWLTEHLGPNPTVDEVIGRIGALLVGNRSFRGDDPYRGTAREGKPFGGGWAGPQFVLTHHPPETPVPGITFVGDLASGVAAAKAAAGDKYVNVIGASVARQCLDVGVLDEILVCIAPVLLGDGVRLFDHPGGTNVQLERFSLTQVPLATNLWLRVSPGGLAAQVIHCGCPAPKRRSPDTPTRQYRRGRSQVTWPSARCSSSTARRWPHRTRPAMDPARMGSTMGGPTRSPSCYCQGRR